MPRKKTVAKPSKKKVTSAKASPKRAKSAQTKARKETPKKVEWKLHQPDQALNVIFSTIKAVTRSEDVALVDTVDRVLAKDVKATLTLPAHDTSERDGYALKAADVKKKNARLACIGDASAGGAFKGTLKPGQCVRIATGSLIPKGADSIIMFEDTRGNDDGTISATTKVLKGQWIAQAGHDVKKGAVILKKGEVVSPAQIAFASACGLATLPVRARPRVIVFTTGNEVKQPGEKISAGQVYDGNTAALAALLGRHGVEATTAKTVRDTEAAMTRKLKDAASKYDMIVFTGGTSVGDKDYGRRTLDSLGKTLIHGVNVKPGKPVLFGTIGKCAVFGLPGFPTSSLMVAYHFVVPAAHRLAGYDDVAEPWVEGILKEGLSPDPHKLFITPVVFDEQGGVSSAFKGSAAISSVGLASGFVELEASSKAMKAGSPIAVRLL